MECGFCKKEDNSVMVYSIDEPGNQDKIAICDSCYEDAVNFDDCYPEEYEEELTL